MKIEHTIESVEKENIYLKEQLKDRDAELLMLYRKLNQTNALLPMSGLCGQADKY